MSLVQATKTERAFAQLSEALATYPFGSHPAELYGPIRYILALGGKRLRPLMTLAACEALGGDPTEAIHPAMAVEVFHNFSLVHDDVMDEAPLRRGKATVHHKWDVNTAILSGDVMLVKVYDLLLGLPTDRLAEGIKLFNDAASRVCEGQQLDLLFESRTDVSESEYLEMIEGKTAALLGAALELGGLVAKANASDLAHLRSLGLCLGVGFQIQDDILDAFGDAEKFGKRMGGDILSGKKTILLIEAQLKASPSQRAELDRWMADTLSDSARKVAAVKKIFVATGALAYSESKRDACIEEAEAHLRGLSTDDQGKAALRALLERLIVREY